MRGRQEKTSPVENIEKEHKGEIFLNKDDFAYVWRDTVNQVQKITPSIIKNASKRINNVAQ